MRAPPLAGLLAILALAGAPGCTSDDTAAGPVTIDATTSLPDARANAIDAAGSADAARADASVADAARPVTPGFDAAGLDAAGLDSSAAIGCIGTGGTVATTSCCIQAGSYPDTCRLGACSCAPTFSTPTTVCQCPAGTCWGSTVRQCVVWDGGGSPP